MTRVREPNFLNAKARFVVDDDYVKSSLNAPRFTWGFERLPDANGWRISTPNRASVELAPAPNWLMEPENQYQSTLLWVYSLRYLEYIVVDHGDIGYADNIVNSFAEFLESPPGEKRLKTLSSRDHMTSEILHTVTFLGSLTEFTAHDAAASIIDSCLRWAADDNIAVNNHGMMLCASLMQVTRHFEGQNAAAIYEFAATELLDILQEVFDEDGMCSENSPSYHRYYIRYLQGLLQRLPSHNLPAVSSLLHHIHDFLAQAQLALDRITLPNGYLPPLGDGNLENVARAGTSFTAEAETYSPYNGFYSHRKKNIYFAFKCGHSSITHKHADDTSIYLWAAGQTFITDAGHYNYDSADPINVAIKSQRGHSGAFFREFDEYYPGRLYLPSTPLTSGILNRDDQGKLSGTAFYNDVGTIMRTVSWETDFEITLVDRFSTISNAHPVIRFVVPSDIHVTLDENGLSLQGKKARVYIQIQDPGTSVSPANRLRLSFGDSDSDEPFGWIADTFNHAEPAWNIQYSPAGDKPVTTTLKVTF